MADEVNGKVVCRFSLVQEGRQKLQHFFDERFADLNSPHKKVRQKAMADLVALVRGEPEGTGVFPKESLEELHRIIEGKSEYALLLTNCPERTEIEKDAFALSANSYANYLAQALYTIGGIETTNRLLLKRSSHTEKDYKKIGATGGYWHRDMTRMPEQKHELCNEYVVLASPCNSEHAVTDIMNLQAALTAIPEAERKELQLNVTWRSKKQATISAQKLYEQLELIGDLKQIGVETPARELVTKLFPAKGYEEQFARYFSGTAMDLQPGELLFLDEKHMFHRANQGNEESIKQIPEDVNFSRILLHIAGAKGEGRAY